MRGDRQRLEDILETIEKVEKHASRGKLAFQEDELLRVWMVHHLLLIGEAASRLSQGLRSAHPEVPWDQIVAMRNLLVHEYFDVDPDEVWSAVERDMPLLKTTVSQLLR